ncbi:MAG: hypothetical protein GF418_08325 [Chitinivibrionales bacterium]|nr:hypothetical protein [Chitinivibrionales bacterium]MBD3395619.1 hypothetical protein [Chitinivibrionales bacterium]
MKPLVLRITLAGRAAFICSALWIVAAHARDIDTILTGERGHALRGFDPVAYFTLDSAVRGDTAYALEWADVTWLFSSDKHRRLFVENPSKYVPQYGGFCAYGVRFWRKVVTNPRAFSIVDGKLYLNLNDRIRKQWEKRTARNIRKADHRWARVQWKDRT